MTSLLGVAIYARFCYGRLYINLLNVLVLGILIHTNTPQNCDLKVILVIYDALILHCVSALLKSLN